MRLSDVRLNVYKPTHICMHTNTRIQRYTYIHAYMHEFIHKNKPPIITSTTEKGKIIFIHLFIQSGYLYSASLCPLLLRRSRPQSLTVSEFTRRSDTGNRIQSIPVVPKPFRIAAPLLNLDFPRLPVSNFKKCTLRNTNG